MYDPQIDVAAIMREIKANIIPEVSFLEGEEQEDKQIKATEQEVHRVLSFIENTRLDAQPYLVMGMRIPGFGRFNILLRKSFRFLARLIRKSTLHITREQTLVNQSVDANIKALAECNQVIFSGLTAQNKMLKEMILDQHELILRQARDLKKAELIFKEEQKELEQKMNAAIERQGYGIEKIENGLAALRDDITIRISDEMYVHFEDCFRGDGQEIRERAKYYLIKYVNVILEDRQGQIVDLGSGRGEWLSLLKENGYQALGIDTNEKMVKLCQEKGLQVKCQDAISYLKSAACDSVAFISAFQLIEHLSPLSLEELIKEAHRVLRSGGVLLLETPDAQNVEVGSNNFYSDPTHRRPIHKEYLKFLAQEQGFQKTEIAYWKQEQIDEWWDSVVGAETTDVLESTVVRTIAESVRNAFYICPDYALIAIK